MAIGRNNPNQSYLGKGGNNSFSSTNPFSTGSTSNYGTRYSTTDYPEGSLGSNLPAPPPPSPQGNNNVKTYAPDAQGRIRTDTYYPGKSGGRTDTTWSWAPGYGPDGANTGGKPATTTNPDAVYNPMGSKYNPGGANGLSGGEEAAEEAGIDPFTIYDDYVSRLGTSDIQAPESLLDQAYAGKFGSITPFQFAMPERPEMARGLDSQYFASERDRRKDELRNEFFSPFSGLNEIASQASGKGLAGSGVGRRYIQELAIDPYLAANSGVDRDVGQMEFEERSRVETLNAQRLDDWAKNVLETQGKQADEIGRVREWLGTFAATDSTNQTTVDIANAKIDTELKGIAATLTSGVYSTLTTAQIADIQQRIDAIYTAIGLNGKWDEQTMDIASN